MQIFTTSLQTAFQYFQYFNSYQLCLKVVCARFLKSFKCSKHVMIFFNEENVHENFKCLCYNLKIKGRHALSIMWIDKIKHKWKSSIGGRVYLMSIGIGYIQFKCHVKQTRLCNVIVQQTQRQCKLLGFLSVNI